MVAKVIFSISRQMDSIGAKMGIGCKETYSKIRHFIALPETARKRIYFLIIRRTVYLRQRLKFRFLGDQGKEILREAASYQFLHKN